MISGHDFIPELYGFKEFVPQCKDYLFYVFKNGPTIKGKLFQCIFTDRGTGLKCGMIMPNVRRFFYHLLTHSGEKPFTCEHCSISFSQRINLTRHVNSVHLGMKKFACDICHKTYSTQANLTKHYNKNHIK